MAILVFHPGLSKLSKKMSWENYLIKSKGNFFTVNQAEFPFEYFSFGKCRENEYDAL